MFSVCKIIEHVRGDTEMSCNTKHRSIKNCQLISISQLHNYFYILYNFIFMKVFFLTQYPNSEKWDKLTSSYTNMHNKIITKHNGRRGKILVDTRFIHQKQFQDILLTDRYFFEELKYISLECTNKSSFLPLRLHIIESNKYFTI